jgi:carboxymethylenebutenolidase
LRAGNAKKRAMDKLTLDQQAMLAAWQQHTYAEFVLKDADAALATMTENPYVFMISCGTVGPAEVHEYYANHFLPKIPRISNSGDPHYRPSE